MTNGTLFFAKLCFSGLKIKPLNKSKGCDQKLVNQEPSWNHYLYSYLKTVVQGSSHTNILQSYYNVLQIDKDIFAKYIFMLLR